MIKLTDNQLQDRADFIQSYVHAQNAASGSQVDANANVTQRTMATMEAEMYKPLTIQLNRKLVTEKIRELFGDELAEDYLADIKHHYIYVHDETSLKPYCASISLYPYLLQGTKCIGGVSGAPRNLQSYCGTFVNLVYQVASNFAGAVATVEYLHYFDYFARKQYGEDYLNTAEAAIRQEMQGVVYALNQPASARGDQSVFWNISVFDKPYMEEMFGGFYYPDGTRVNFPSLMKLQKWFMEWFRLERRKELLTFPVVTASLLTDSDGFVDEDFKDYCAKQMSEGHSFFVYMSDSVDSLASCCRLRNELADNTFSYTLGAGGLVTGSAQVITLNINRIVQDAFRLGEPHWQEYLRTFIHGTQKYLLATRAVYQQYVDMGLLPVYSAGLMSLDKQFLTLGLNGVVEAAEFLRLPISDNPPYRVFLKELLSMFKAENKYALQRYGVRFNTEFVPAENLGVKNAKWDREDGYIVRRDCYNSYLYAVEDTELTVFDKIALYGKNITDNLDGGSALHLNLEQLLTEKNAQRLFEACRREGVPYWTTNVKCTICNECGYINPHTENHCTKCGSVDVDYGTRIIGYLKRISNFSEPRKAEAARRYYSTTN